jgi:transcriptional regulator with XRE-family HTH domain
VSASTRPLGPRQRRQPVRCCPVPELAVGVGSRLPVFGAGSVTALARKGGIQPTTATSWWTKGYVPAKTSLRLLAEALGEELSDLIAAYEGSSGRPWVLSDPELEVLIERAVEKALRRVLDRCDAEGPGREAVGAPAEQHGSSAQPLEHGALA